MIPFSWSDAFPERAPSGHWFVRSAPAAGADEELALSVAARIRANLPGGGHRMVVEVQNRVVILEGVVATAGFRRQAHRVAAHTPGVFDVSNRLAVAADELGGGSPWS